MSYRIARSTLALTIIIITFAPSCDDITNPESSAVNFTVNISGNVSNSSTRANVPSSFKVSFVNERNKGILVEANRDINLYGMSFHFRRGSHSLRG